MFDAVPVRQGAPPDSLRGEPRVLVPNLSRVPGDPLVSCLCITENRHAFVPWLLWAYDRQQWRNRELVVVDSSQPPIKLPERRDIQVLTAPPGASLGRKRNLALDAARGHVVAWFDDDDWQHPERLSMLVPDLQWYAGALGASYLGPSRSWFLGLNGSGCESYQVDDYAIFNGSVFYREMVGSKRFPEDVADAEDTRWLWAVLQGRRGAALAGRQPVLFFWLSHDANVVNRREKRSLDVDPVVLRRAVGKAAWGDTDKQLEALRARLEESS